MTSQILIAIIGGIVGLLYSSGRIRSMNAILRFVVGALGGFLGIWFFAGVLGLVVASATVNVLLGILYIIIGALVLLAIADAISFSMFRAREERRIRRARRVTRGYAREYRRGEETRRGREYDRGRDYDEVEVKRTYRRKKK